MELRIIIETKIISHLYNGGVQTTVKEYKMQDGNAAEIYYKKEMENANKSGGFIHVSINVVTKVL